MVYSGRTAFFTINNYTDDDIKKLDQLHRSKGVLRMSAQTEVGEGGTPHIQGFIRYNGNVPDWHKKVSHRAHFEHPQSESRCMNYCRKTESHDGIHRWFKDEKPQSKKRDFKEALLEASERAKTKRRKKVGEPEWKDWQQEIIDLKDKEPEERTIYWYWSEEGNIGKSFLKRYLVVNDLAWSVNGGRGDFLHSICNQFIHLEDAKYVIIDIPRNQGNRISYSALEDLSNGLINTTKYDSNVVHLPDVHKVVFANSPPDMSAMSADRFVIRKIGTGVVPPMFLTDDVDLGSPVLL